MSHHGLRKWYALQRCEPPLDVATFTSDFGKPLHIAIHTCITPATFDLLYYPVLHTEGIYLYRWTLIAPLPPGRTFTAPPRPPGRTFTAP